MTQQLAYCGFGVSDPESWVRFASEGLGLPAYAEGGTTYLRMDDRPWRFALHPSGEDDILYAGFAFDSEREWQDFIDSLLDLEFPVTDFSDEQCADRNVTAGVWLSDPQGLRLEFVHGHERLPSETDADRVSGFVTGDQGLGHIVVSVTDFDRALKFYETIGLKLSDTIVTPFGPADTLRIAFMHCNPRHHSLAFACLPGEKRLNHVMIERAEVDGVLIAHQRCRDMEYMPGNIGRHPNDLTLSFYVPTPSGFDFELGYGGVAVDGDWQVREYEAISLWGHERAS